MPAANKKTPLSSAQNPAASKATTAAGTSRKRKMDAVEQKYYAVRAGFTPGVYTDYAMCQQQISGFKGAQFKSFPTYEDAALFAAGQDPPSRPDEPERYYAVARGNKPGVYTNWPAAQRAIAGVKGPKHKKFNTRAEAEEFVRTYRISDADVTSSNTTSSNTTSSNMTSSNTTDGVTQPPAKKAKTATDAGSPSLIVIYTDGSSLGNGRLGAAAGVGVFFGPEDPRNVAERLQGEVQTNQRAELTAILRALEAASDDQGVEIRTDSKYSINCVTMWYQNWERNNWMKAGRDPVMNQDLIKAIRARIEARDEKGTKTQFVWVKGHASDPGNHAADALANEGARKLLL